MELITYSDSDKYAEKKLAGLVEIVISLKNRTNKIKK